MKKVYRVEAVGVKDGMVIGVSQNILANGHDNSISKQLTDSSLDEIWSIKAKLNVGETIKMYARYFWEKLWEKKPKKN